VASPATARLLQPASKSGKGGTEEAVDDNGVGKREEAMKRGDICGRQRGGFVIILLPCRWERNGAPWRRVC
jgi:hypothetical protein